MLGFINFIIYGKIIDFYRWHIIAYGGKQIGDLATYGMITNNKQFEIHQNRKHTHFVFCIFNNFFLVSIGQNEIP